METTLLANPPTLQCSPYQEVNGKIHCLQPLEGLLKFKYIIIYIVLKNTQVVIQSDSYKE